MTGRLVTFTKRWFGLGEHGGWNALGHLGGDSYSGCSYIDLGLGEIKITFEDLISAFVGSLFVHLYLASHPKGAGPKSNT